MGWLTDPYELVGDGKDEREPGKEERVKDQAICGALSLLSDRVGDEFEGVNFVVAGREDVEGERWDIVQNRRLGLGCGRPGVRDVSGEGRGSQREALRLEKRRGDIGGHGGWLEGEIGPEKVEEGWWKQTKLDYAQTM